MSATTRPGPARFTPSRRLSRSVAGLAVLLCAGLVLPGDQVVASSAAGWRSGRHDRPTQAWDADAVRRWAASGTQGPIARWSAHAGPDGTRAAHMDLRRRSGTRPTSAGPTSAGPVSGGALADTGAQATTDPPVQPGPPTAAAASAPSVPSGAPSPPTTAMPTPGTSASAATPSEGTPTTAAAPDPSFAGQPYDDSVLALGQLPDQARTLSTASSSTTDPAPAPASPSPAPIPAPATTTQPADPTAPAVPAVPVGSTRPTGTTGSALQRMYGPAGSGLPWLSGFWTGGYGSAAHVQAAGQWRGRPMDLVTAYPAYATWNQLESDTFAIGTFDGFTGRLAYGLPLLPGDRRGQWGDITSGAHDAVFTGIARQLAAHGRGDSVIRVGLEANGSWFPWGATAGTADQFKAAFRRVVGLMRAQAPQLTFWFDTSAGSALAGGSGRLDALTVLYPGDDVVDGISMDHFDFYQLVARDDAQFAAAMRPASGPGLADAVDFARAHGKGFAVPEWGIHGVQGPGDNPFFMQAMFGFFSANTDVLVFENYFNEPDPYIANALFEASNNPQSASTYRSLWGKP